MPGCPGETLLVCLLAEELAGAEREAVEGHLEDCPRCQTRVEQLLGQGTVCRAAAHASPGLDFPDPNPTFLEHLRDLPLPRFFDSPTNISQKTSLGGTRWPVPRTPEPLPGLIGNYEVLAELGRGGMGVVYKARHTKLPRVVALKMIQARMAGRGEYLSRFRREAESVARIRHLNVLEIYEIGEHEGAPYLVLPFAEGGNLSEFLNGCPQEPRAAAALLEKVARAVHHAHGQGIVHRDLKPANILLDAGPLPAAGATPCLEDYEPKISDFGLAKCLDQGEVGLTHTGVLVGTPTHLAPEQVDHLPGSAAPAADIYALGVILYELLTGRPPFVGTTVSETLHLVRTSEPVPPHSLQPRVPRDLETICLKCLNKEPARRYATALALAEDLRRFQEGQPIQARPLGPGGRCLRWARRNPRVAGLTAALALTLLAGAAVSAALAVQARESAARASQNAADSERHAAEARVHAEAAREQARRAFDHSYVADIRMVRLAWDESQIAQVRSLLDGLRPEGSDDRERRGFEWHYWWRLSHLELASLEGHGAAVWAVAWSPDGSRLASAAINGSIRIWDPAAGKTVRELRGHEGSVRALAYAPDGKHLASASADGTARLWDLTTGEPVATLRETEDAVNAICYSPDGRHLATAGQGGAARLWEAGTGKLVRTFRDDAVNTFHGVALSPDGKYLAGAGSARAGDSTGAGARSGKDVVVWEVATGREAFRLPGHASAVRSLAFAPGGKTLLSGSSDSTLRVWDLATRKERHTLQGHAKPILGAAFTRDGRYLVSASVDQTVKLWETTHWREHFVFKGHLKPVLGVAPSPDGRRLATAGTDQAVKIWDLEGALALPMSLRHPSRAVCASPSPDGKLLATGGATTGRRGMVYLWDLISGNSLATLAGHAEPVQGVCFSPDGRLLASAGRDCTVRLWDVATRRATRVLQGSGPGLMSVCFDPAGKLVAAASLDGTIRAWDVATGDEAFTLKAHAGGVTDLCFGAGGNRLASTGRDGTVRVWDVATRSEVLALQGGRVGAHGVCYSPDGTRLAATCGDNSLRLWDGETGELLQTLRGHSANARCVAFSPDGRRLVSGASDRTVRLWDADSGQEVLVLRDQGQDVYAACFTADGQRLVSAGSDGRVRVWYAPATDRKR